MKKRLLIILITSALLYSCNEVNRKDIVSVAEKFETSFMKNDLIKLKPYFEYNMDSLSDSQTEKVKELQDFFNTNEIKKIDVDTSGSWFWQYCDISYLVDNSYYEVSFSYERDSLNDIIITGVYLININEKCIEAQNKPYCPTKDIEFKSITWQTDYYSKSFKSGSIQVQNNTDYDLNYIKFRVILAKGTSKYYLGEKFFNQTVESYKPIYKGDIATVNIPGMEDFYAGFKIEQDNLQFSAELIELKPKPISDWRLKVDRLDEKVKKMLNQ